MTIIPKSGFKHKVADVVRHTMPEAYFFMMYYRGMGKLGNSYDASVSDFNRLLQTTAGKPCLQIGVKEVHGAKFGPNWVSVDLDSVTFFL